jgi:hypothetical protein
MQTFLTPTLPFAMLGVLLVAGSNVATATAKQKDTSSYECSTDDGYGRRLPCSYGYERQKSADKNQYDCSTDDGFGRRLPCSYRFKR